MKIKPFLIIQLRPEREVSDNEFEAFMKCGNLKFEEVVRLQSGDRGFSKINIERYSGIITGGSPFDISIPENMKSAIQKKVEENFRKLFDKVIELDFPFLGVCSGNGLLGKHCGANISNKHGEEVGGVDIALTNEGKKDPLLKGLPSVFRALTGHKEACDNLPKKSVLLASSKFCPIQMFRIGKNVYAVQFHPEANADVFTLRINVYKNHGYFPPESAEELIKRVRKEQITKPRLILENFVSKYKTQSVY